MNRRPRNTHHNKPKTPYCKVCHDAGKPRAVYTSHYVKDRPGPNGKVVCPYLLSLKCRYCHETGHTPNHCPNTRHNAERKNGYHHHKRQDKSKKPDKDGWIVKTPTRRPKKHNCNAPRKPKRKAEKKNQFETLINCEEKLHFPTLGNQSITVPQVSRSKTTWSAVVTKDPVLVEENTPLSKIKVYTDDDPCQGWDTSDSEDRFKGMSWYDIVVAEEAEEEEERIRELMSMSPEKLAFQNCARQINEVPECLYQSEEDCYPEDSYYSSDESEDDYF